MTNPEVCNIIFQRHNFKGEITMKLKKTITGLLAVTVLSTSAVTAFAADAQNILDKEVRKDIVPISAPIDNEDLIEIIPIDEPVDEELEEALPIIKQEKQVGWVTGKVKEVRDFIPAQGSKFVTLVDEEGEIIANVVVSEDTFILDGVEIDLGSTVTAYYDATKPMILIYPPQFNAEVLVVEEEGRNVKVDVFDENLVSSDNMLKLNMSEDTEVVLQDGTAFDEDLAGRKLVVIYGASTKSIPAQTTPEKVIVLFENEEDKEDLEDVDYPEYDSDTEEYKEFTKELQEMAAKADIMVEGKKIEGPSAYMTDERILMVPLRAIAEALNFEVAWDGELRKVMVGKAISLTIDENYYTFAKMAPIELEVGPEIVEDITFVPVSFFREVVDMNNAYMFEGQIVIDNEEKME